MWSNPSHASQILRGIVAVGCALAFSLVLLPAWGSLGGITLPALYERAQGDPEQWFTYSFWYLIRLSLPFWIGALWLTAIGSFFGTRDTYRMVRRVVWLVPAGICCAAFLVQADIGGIGTRFMTSDATYEHLASAEVILP